MPKDSADASRSLPEHPNLRHLKDQAKDLLKTGGAGSITDACPRLKAHVEVKNEIAELKQAIDNNDFEQVKALMTKHPALHQAPLGYANNGPLTWVAECRIPWEAPAPVRLEMAKWMLENGSDVHQGGDGPLMRAALRGERIPMMELLVSYGANVNAEWNSDFPILFAPCESVNPVAMRWLLEHGANPNCPKSGRKTTALDYLIGSYARSRELGTCIDLLRNAGGISRYDVPGVLDTIPDRHERLAVRLEAEPALVHHQFPELDCGASGGRRLLLTGATLLHVAAEFGSIECAKLLLAKGAAVNARVSMDDTKVGGQTAIFHAVTQFDDWGLAITQLLLERGADLSVRAKLPGHYERPEEVVECTPLGYAMRFPGSELPNEKTIRLLREHGAKE